MKLLKNKKGSILVEKILMAAFAVAAGGAVVVYGTNVINNSKNTEITGILSGGEQMSQEKLNAHFNDSTYTVSLTAQEINSKSFGNLVSTIRGVSDYQPYNWLNGSSVTADGKYYYNDEILADVSDYYVCYRCSDGPGYNFFLGHVYWNWGSFEGINLFEETQPHYTKIDATGNFTWNINNAAFYELVKPALIADLS